MINTEALRRKIIDSAVTGMLTTHSGGNADKELDDIIAKLHTNPQKPNSEDVWADIPKSWAWAKLSNLTTPDTLNDGDWVLSVDMVPQGDVKLIQLGSIGDCVFKNNGFKYLTENHFNELNGKRIYPGYLLVNRLVVNRMLSCLVPNLDGILMTAVDVCWIAPNDSVYNLRYIMYALSSSGFQKKVNSLGRGVTRFRISKLNLIDIAIPLPPREDQDRIIKKVDELYALIDKIDELQKKYDADVEVLKNKIIDAGIQGKLTQQLPEDGNAEDLYERIQEEKQKLIAEGKLKKEKPLPEIEDDDIPFDIPSNWKWVRVASVAEVSGGMTPKGNEVSSSGTIPYFKVSDMNTPGNETHMVHANMFITSEYTGKVFPVGTTIFPKNGGAALTNKRRLLTVPSAIDLNTGGCTPIVHSMSDWIRLYLDTIDFGKMDTGSNIPTVNASNLKTQLLPLPPLNEQERIVQLVESALEIIDS